MALTVQVPTASDVTTWFSSTVQTVGVRLSTTNTPSPSPPVTVNCAVSPGSRLLTVVAMLSGIACSASTPNMLRWRVKIQIVPSLLT